ncbi:methylenetetrahydrofolate reductase [NAD(P)H] [Tropicimonas sp. IMCC34043]|uniref:methylenetetrahydrofolate reductase [NAD(P)H] n=1 Tax=Tropicimonas sp. IMCC34043 TaxID=2248760 RepID=UPI000E272D27|nr:methylenetetrahydrofolate reductase [NAD(P)H] [Tropicimonas sp. IMCC34043]
MTAPATSLPHVSFEFFPPRSVEASFRLYDAVKTLAPLSPEFVSVTYGAGGTTRKLTHEAVSAIHHTTGLRVAAHLTCVDATREDTLEIARGYAAEGVRDIVALRGDPPKGQTRFVPHPEGFADSCELIAALKSEGDFTIRVGAYPDPHPEADDDMADVRWLKRKFEAGADAAITQFFFEADTFFRFRDACAAAGIDRPILPGILPIENWKNARRFAQRCGARIPAWLDAAFDDAGDGAEAEALSIEIAAQLCRNLMEGGVDHLHFYTLNKPTLSRRICQAVGIVANPSLEAVA